MKSFPRNIACLWFSFFIIGCAHTPSRIETPSEKLPFKAFNNSDLSAPIFPVYQNQMVWVKTPGQVALVDFTELGECQAKYRFRLYDCNSGLQTNGVGEVFEKYERIKTENGKVTLKDLGSLTEISAGAIKLGWSCGSKSRGYSWVYSRRDTMDLRIIHNKNYDHFNFYPVR